MTAGSTACEIAGGHIPPLQWLASSSSAICYRPASRQPVGEERGPCRNANILLTILAHIGNRIGVSHLRRFHAPQFLPRLCVEGAEHAVQRGSNKREPSRRRHRATAQAGTTSLDPG